MNEGVNVNINLYVYVCLLIKKVVDKPNSHK